MEKNNRVEYQQAYHARNPAAAALRKEKERALRDRAAAYWRFKILLRRDLPGLINGISDEIIGQEERRYRQRLTEPVAIEVVEHTARGCDE